MPPAARKPVISYAPRRVPGASPGGASGPRIPAAGVSMKSVAACSLARSDSTSRASPSSPSHARATKAARSPSGSSTASRNTALIRAHCPSAGAGPDDGAATPGPTGRMRPRVYLGPDRSPAGPWPRVHADLAYLFVARRGTPGPRTRLERPRMRSHSLLPSAVALVATLACDGGQTTDPSTIQTSLAAASLALGEHGGGPPGSVVFYSRRGGTLAKIYTMSADGSDVTPVTSGPGNDLWPDLSTNGRYIAFASTRSGNSEIYVLDLADGTLTNVSNSSADDSWP